MRARIYRPARSATQSGPALSRHWVLEYAPEEPRRIDPLMGWTSSGDMRSQIQLRFDSREAAEAYAREHGLEAVVIRAKPRKANVRPGGYGDNFSTNRRRTWTH